MKRGVKEKFIHTEKRLNIFLSCCLMEKKKVNDEHKVF